MSSREPRRLSPAKTLILHFLYSRGRYSGSIIQLSRDMGYSTDSSVNKNLNDLVREGYVTEGPPFGLTSLGLKAVRFSSLPDVLVGLLIGISVVDMAISGEAILGIPNLLNAPAIFGLGAGVLALALVLYRQKRRLYDDFLGLKKGLSPPESASRDEGEALSQG